MKRILTAVILSVLSCMPMMAELTLTPDQEITFMLQNPGFKDGFSGWSLTRNGGSLTIQESAGGIMQVQGTGCDFVLEQTVTGLPDGIYEFEIDGYYAAEAMPQSMLHGSMIYMNDMKNVFISSYEYMQLPSYPTNKVMARSQNGELNIKIAGRNIASSADVTLFSNLHLFYRGQTDSEAMNAYSSLHTDMQYILQTAHECHSSDIGDYVQHPSCNYSLMRDVGLEGYDNTVSWSKIMETLKYFGELLEDVRDCRAAYINLMRNVLQTENTANLLVSNNLLTDQQYSQATSLLDTAMKGYQEGTLTAGDAEGLTLQLSALDGMPKYVDNVMQISTPQDLSIFSVLVNDGMRTLDAQLTADIDMSGISGFQPIGLYSDTVTERSDYRSNSYGGTFNGQGFEVRNLTLQTTHEGGLFGRCYRARISNLGMVNVSVTGTGAQTCGALAGTLMQTQVDNCYVAGTVQVQSNGQLAAQFAGEAAWNTVISKCYTLGDDFTNATAAQLNNCYWGNMATKGARSGELCYNINDGETVDPVYFQTLGKDNWPVLLSSHEIVRHSNEGFYYNGDYEDGIGNIEEQGARSKEQGIFDLSGRRISGKPARGMYIQGGKVRL